MEGHPLGALTVRGEGDDLPPHPSPVLTSLSLCQVPNRMIPQHASSPSERLRLRQVVVWTVFGALLVLGLVLWFRYSGRIVPMLDSLTDR